MHNCEEFRERITEHIIDRENVAARAEFRDELLICSSCSEFYSESQDVIEALSSVDLGISELQWGRIEQRLRARIMNAESPAPVSSHAVRTRSKVRDYMRASAWLTVAALALVTVGLSRLAIPVAVTPTPVEPASGTATFVEPTVPLDPVTVDFLEQSELLLRNVMKISPSDVDDLADAKKTANEQLAGIQLRKEAAVEVPPVVDVMETYETILRDLRNLDEHNASEDIPDIQKRIQNNALIANMKAFQPTVTQISFGLR
jgi:hypothetical protein